MSIDPLEAGRRASWSFRNAGGSDDALLFSTLYISNELVVRCLSRDLAGWSTIQRNGFPGSLPKFAYHLIGRRNDYWPGALKL